MTAGEKSILSPHRRDICYVFVDLRGFTAFVDSAEPEEVENVLRDYHAAMGAIVTEHEGTLDRFPGLKICAAHGGGYLPFYAPRSDAICVTFPDRCASVPLKKKPTEYLKQLYYDSIIFTPEALKTLIAEVGVGRIMMGTDYPFPWTHTSVDHILNTPGLSDADKTAMLGDTAVKLLCIKTH